MQGRALGASVKRRRGCLCHFFRLNKRDGRNGAKIDGRRAEAGAEGTVGCRADTSALTKHRDDFHLARRRAKEAGALECAVPKDRGEVIGPGRLEDVAVVAAVAAVANAVASAVRRPGGSGVAQDFAKRLHRVKRRFFLQVARDEAEGMLGIAGIRAFVVEGIEEESAEAEGEMEDRAAHEELRLAERRDVAVCVVDAAVGIAPFAAHQRLAFLPVFRENGADLRDARRNRLRRPRRVARRLDEVRRRPNVVVEVEGVAGVAAAGGEKAVEVFDRVLVDADGRAVERETRSRRGTLLFALGARIEALPREGLRLDALQVRFVAEVEQPDAEFTCRSDVVCPARRLDAAVMVFAHDGLRVPPPADGLEGRLREDVQHDILPVCRQRPLACAAAVVEVVDAEHGAERRPVERRRRRVGDAFDGGHFAIGEERRDGVVARRAGAKRTDDEALCACIHGGKQLDAFVAHVGKRCVGGIDAEALRAGNGVVAPIDGEGRRSNAAEARMDARAGLRRQGDLVAVRHITPDRDFAKDHLVAVGVLPRTDPHIAGCRRFFEVEPKRLRRRRFAAGALMRRRDAKDTRLEPFAAVVRKGNGELRHAPRPRLLGAPDRHGRDEIGTLEVEDGGGWLFAAPLSPDGRLAVAAEAAVLDALATGAVALRLDDVGVRCELALLDPRERCARFKALDIRRESLAPGVAAQEPPFDRVCREGGKRNQSQKRQLGNGIGSWQHFLSHANHRCLGHHAQHDVAVRHGQFGTGLDGGREIYSPGLQSGLGALG